jgi:hypothetical protein
VIISSYTITRDVHCKEMPSLQCLILLVDHGCKIECRCQQQKKFDHFMPQTICTENCKLWEKVIKHKIQSNLFSFTSQTSDLKMFWQNEMQTPQ